MDEYYSKYLKYKKKYLELKKTIDNKNMTGGAKNSKTEKTEKTEVILFKASWCGHCQMFLPTWEKMSEKYKSKYNFMTFDSDINENETNNWGVRSFPTIFIKKGDVAAEYHGSRDEMDILKFINQVEKAK